MDRHVETPHSIFRFKRGSTEFEFVGSEADVAKAWDLLGPVVASALKGASNETTETNGSSDKANVANRKPTRRVARRTPSAGSGAREEIRTKLLETPLEGFPHLGDNPTARYAGYALLDWAKGVLEIDGLTVAEIATFYQDRFGIPNTPAAYREGFRGRAREVMKSGTPAQFRLAKDGKIALDKYVERVAAGATSDEASAAAEKEAA